MKRMMAVAVACAWAAWAAAWGQECVLRAEIRGSDRFAAEFLRFWKGTRWEGVEDVFERDVFDKERAVWEALDRKGTVSFAVYGDGIAEGAPPAALAAVLPVKDPEPVYAWLERFIGADGWRMEELGVRLYDARDGDGTAAAVESDGRVVVAWSFGEAREAERVLGMELHEAEPVAAAGTFAVRAKGCALGEGAGRAWFGDDWRDVKEIFRENAVLRGVAAALAGAARSEWTEIGVGLRGKTVRVDFASKGDWARGGGGVAKRRRSKALAKDDVAFVAVDRSGRAVRTLEALRRRAASWAERGGEGGVARVLSAAGWEKLAARLGGETGVVELWATNPDKVPPVALWVERAERAAEIREWVRRHAATAPDGLLQRLGGLEEPPGRLSLKWLRKRKSGKWAVDAYALLLDGKSGGMLELAWGGADGPVVASTLGKRRLDALLADWSAGRRIGAEAAEGFRKRMKGAGKRAGREYEGFAEVWLLADDAEGVLGALARASGNTAETPWKRAVGKWLSVLGDAGEGEILYDEEDDDADITPAADGDIEVVGWVDWSDAGVAWRAGRIGGGVFAGSVAIPEKTLRRWVSNATEDEWSCRQWWVDWEAEEAEWEE